VDGAQIGNRYRGDTFIKVRRKKMPLHDHIRHPFLVDVPAPDARESDNLTLMERRAQQLSSGAYETTRRKIKTWSERSGLEFARFHFADETAAEAFATEFADLGAVYISRK
jgi:hypothetical protein